MDNVKLCPFCDGKEPELKTNASGLNRVECNDCMARAADFVSIEEAEDAWSRRADDWISVKDELPEHDQTVEIWTYKGIHTVHFYRGYTDEQAEALWAKGESVSCRGLQHGNNLVPYEWTAVAGPMNWFGQDVKFWRPKSKGPTDEQWERR